MTTVFRVGAAQMKVRESKEENLETAYGYLRKLKKEGAEIAVLPEMFCVPYRTDLFPVYAEREGERTWSVLSDYAKKLDLYLVAGSVPEVDEEGRVYNTSYIFSRKGDQIGKHRKVHLFDVNIKGGQYYKESDSLSPGDHVTVFNTEYGKMGVIICFDIRFPEMIRRTVHAGAKIVFTPAAFNMSTGPAHWELSFRARALDNQIYMVGCAPARDESSCYISWGHSICTDPWGRVAAQLDEKEGILLADIDMAYEEQIREQLPLLKSRIEKIDGLS